jgi:hypothetical protein
MTKIRPLDALILTSADNLALLKRSESLFILSVFYFFIFGFKFRLHNFLIKHDLKEFCNEYSSLVL